MLYYTCPEFLAVGLEKIFTSQTTFKEDTTINYPLKDLGLVIFALDFSLGKTNLCEKMDAYFFDKRTYERVYFDNC